MLLTRPTVMRTPMPILPLSLLLLPLHVVIMIVLTFSSLIKKFKKLLNKCKSGESSESSMVGSRSYGETTDGFDHNILYCAVPYYTVL